MNTIKINKKNVKMIAHRGVSKLERENTVAAFIAAGNRSYYGIETDVHVTADGKFIIIHDDVTGRVADTDMSVENSYYDDLRKLRVKDFDDNFTRCDLRLPNLTEYINCCKRYEKIAVLELKNPMEETAILEICKEIEALEYLGNVIFISFCFENLVCLKKHYPNQKAQFLTADKNTSGLPQKLKSYNMDLDICHLLVTKELVDECHANGVEVNCWTVDETEIAQKMIDCGVDYITTNILE